MEFENSKDKYYLYDKLRKLAIISVEDGLYEKAQKILTLMTNKWPERVFAKGKSISNMDVSHPKLDTPNSIP